ncbi:L-2-hydroxyglutarate oxidase [Arsenicicoccus sp. MKL-02]|uniref:L-2-hydroxyglutarate oxidase n=1 Tax=Arsenicicoccus cauae TaxID=2663847 RepID=A0A6I3I5H6_9MICO|nr:L-2-hydroxyglutarate oxidase [Arsenicicoccus cauae]MTB71444.1 L-2-hydroxyglutarate oxidase [Arsenicicoccus cauae]
MKTEADVLVVGGGIVGLATARALQLRKPGAHVVVIDKEDDIARHQTGNNSGVIHAGVYYTPGSYKARLCFDGRVRLVEYLQDKGIPHRIDGKLVVATNADEVDKMKEIQRRCQANNVPTQWMSREEFREVEPHAEGVAALQVKVTGVVDYKVVCQSYADDIRAAGGEIRTGTALVSGRPGLNDVTVETTQGPIVAKQVVTCGGLNADLVAKAMGARPETRIVGFRGEYYELTPEKSYLCNALIYPVPDPRFPFLGVHATKGIDGHVHLGPNAVIALAREGYSWTQINPRDMVQLAAFPGIWRLAQKYWKYSIGEVQRSFSKEAFVKATQKMMPEVQVEDVVRAGAGVRAQAMRPDGTLVEDFDFLHEHPRVLHVLNAPSPAATASLAIAEVIADKLAEAERVAI